MPKLSIRPSFFEGEMVIFGKIKWLYLCNDTNLLKAFFFLTAKLWVGQKETLEGSTHHIYKTMMCIYKDSNDTLLGHIQSSALRCAWRENACLTLKWPLWLMLTAVLMSGRGCHIQTEWSGRGHSFGDYSTTATFQQSKSVFSVSGTYLQVETVHCLCFALIRYQKNAFADELLRNSWGLGQFPCASGLCCHCQSTPSFPANPFHPPGTWAYITRRIKLSHPSLNKCPFQKYNIKQT